MPEIQSSDPGRKLRDRYNLVGASPSPFLSPELVPVVLVDDLTEADVLSVEFERLCTVHQVAPAVVGERSVINLVNPANSGVLLIGEQWYISTGSGGQAAIEMRRGVAPAIATNGEFRDSRLSGAPVCGTQVTSAPGAQQGEWQQQIENRTIDTGSAIFLLPYILSPGNSLDISGSISNLSLECSIRWKERTL